MKWKQCPWHIVYVGPMMRHVLVDRLLNLVPSVAVRFSSVSAARRPSLSLWRKEKEMSKEGLFIIKEIKRLRSDPTRLARFIDDRVYRLVRSDLLSVLRELNRQDKVFLSMKLYEVVRKEIWYRPDMFFYEDMLLMLIRNKKVDEIKRVWKDLKEEKVLFNQYTFANLVRAFLKHGLVSEAMFVYREMRESPDPPNSHSFRVIIEGLVPYPELRDKIKGEVLKLYPKMKIYDPPEDLFDDKSLGLSDSDDDD